MNRIVVIATGALVLIVAGISAVAQTTPQPTPTPTPTPAARPATPPTPQPVQPANAPVPNTKIAVVNTEAFRDDKFGITRYLNAFKSIEAEFKPRNLELLNLQNRIKAIADEITKLSGATVAADTIQAKQDEGERLQRDLKYKKDQAEADFQKRYNEAVLPISRDIGNALSEYANQHGLTMILDVSKLEPAILTLNPATDITLAFIADYNSKHP